MDQGRQDPGDFVVTNHPEQQRFGDTQAGLDGVGSSDFVGFDSSVAGRKGGSTRRLWDLDTDPETSVSELLSKKDYEDLEGGLADDKYAA